MTSRIQLRSDVIILGFMGVLAFVLLVGGSVWAAEKVRIVHVEWNEAPILQAEAFNRLQDKIEVVPEVLAASRWTEALQTRIAGGVGPDVFRATWASPDYNPITVLGPAGIMADLEPFVRKDRQQLQWDAVPEVIRRRGVIEGKRYGLPESYYAGHAVLYNRELMARAGLPDPPVSWTVDDFVQYARRLTRDASGDGIPDEWGLHPMGDRFPRVVSTWFYNEMGTQFLGNTQQFRRGIQFLQDLYQTYKVTPPPSMGVDVGPAMSRGITGMFYTRSNGLYWSTHLVAQRDLDLGLQYAPWDPETGKRGAQYADGSFFAINRASSPEHQAAAWEYLKFLIGEQGVWPALYSSMGGMVNRMPLRTTEVRRFFLSPRDTNISQLDLSVYVNNTGLLERANPDEPTVNVASISAVWKPNIGKLIEGQMSTAEFVDTVAPVINRLLAEK